MKHVERRNLSYESGLILAQFDPDSGGEAEEWRFKVNLWNCVDTLRSSVE